jgi:hypothetical protein
MGNVCTYLRTTTKSNKTTIMKKLLFFILFPILTYGQVQIGQDIDGENPNDGIPMNISLSSEGNVVAVGAIGNDGNGGDNSSSGQVKIYENQNGNWTQIGQDINGGNILENLGVGLSLSSNGAILAIGGPGNNTNGVFSGQVKVYENQNGNWIQIGQDITGEESDNLGSSINLSSSGAILALTRFDRVQVYENQNGNWTQIGQDIECTNQNLSVSLSPNGNMLAIGNRSNDDNGTNAGQVRVYENQNGNWTQIGQNINGNSSGDLSGRSISLSVNGNILAIGALGGDGNGVNSGRVKVYENQGGNWIQIGQDINGEAEQDRSGRSISLSANGNIVAIGANQNDGNGDNSGHVRIYQNQSGSWIQIGQDIDGESIGDLSGDSVSLSSNGNIVAISAEQNDGNGDSSGHVRGFDLRGLVSIEVLSSSTFSMYPNPASTQITIEIPQGSTLEKATIYNNLGQLVLSSKNTTIDTSILSKGMYIVEVFTAQGTSSKKLIIE